MLNFQGRLPDVEQKLNTASMKLQAKKSRSSLTHEKNIQYSPKKICISLEKSWLVQMICSIENVFFQGTFANFQGPKPLLFVVYMGLYYPNIFGDYNEAIIKIPINQSGFHGMS